MNVQPVGQRDGTNPRNDEEARALVSRVESLFMPWNIDALVSGFTSDCIVRFGTLPQFGGTDALRSFFEARMRKQKNYRLRKTFKSLVNDTMTNVWEGDWQDAETGTAMKGFGVEVWELRGGKIAVWEGAFNTSPAADNRDVSRPFG